MGKSAQSKCHDGPIWKIRLSDPKVGQLIATCSQDKGVVFGKKRNFCKKIILGRNKQLYNGNRENQFWKVKKQQQTYNLVQSQMVYILAIAYVDGKLQIDRVYEQNQFIKEGEDIQIMIYGLRATSSNHAPLEKEMLVVVDYFNEVKTMGEVRIYQNQNGIWDAKGIIQEANIMKDSMSLQQFTTSGLIS